MSFPCPTAALVLSAAEARRDIEPWSAGKAASSGCVSMLNEDVFEPYGSVPVGTRVVVG